jgi:hypothetical protein
MRLKLLLEELEEHITSQHVKTIADLVHYLAQLENRIQAIEARHP